MPWETIASYDNAVAAELAKNLLEENDIEVMLNNEEVVAMNWSLANAVSGIQLQVRDFDAPEARELLKRKQSATDVEVAEAVAASPEAAAQMGPAEPFDDTPTDLTLDSAFRVTVFGLMIPPLFPVQLYALYLLATLYGAQPPVKPERRWKIWASLALNVPLWGVFALAVVILLPMVSGRFRDPAGPSWRNARFGGFGDVALFVDLPGPYHSEANNYPSPLGPIKARSFDVGSGKISLLVAIHSLPRELTPENPQEAMRQLAEHLLEGAKIDSAVPTKFDGYPALDLTSRFVDPTTKQQLVARDRIALVDHHFIVLFAEAPPGEENDPTITRFFQSAKLRE